jgi:hypothetical protein
MLRRPLNSNDAEYEIQDSTKHIEQEFYKYFLEYIEKINFDIIEYQIILNPLQFTMEVRIRMGKLYRCFANRFSLDRLMECYYDKGTFTDICEETIHPVLEYARSLCYKEE